jgi:hypothetical protein
MARPRDPDDLERPAPDTLEDGIPATEEVLEEQLLTGDIEEGPIAPEDHPLALDEWGVVAVEERRGEPLDRRLAAEEPDIIRRDVSGPLPRLYQSGSDDASMDSEDQEVGDLDASREDTLSSEEAAIRIVDRPPPGMTFDEGPDYLEPE